MIKNPIVTEENNKLNFKCFNDIVVVRKFYKFSSNI